MIEKSANPKYTWKAEAKESECTAGWYPHAMGFSWPRGSFCIDVHIDNWQICFLRTQNRRREHELCSVRSKAGRAQSGFWELPQVCKNCW